MIPADEVGGNRGRSESRLSADVGHDGPVIEMPGDFRDGNRFS